MNAVDTNRHRLAPDQSSTTRLTGHIVELLSSLDPACLAAGGNTVTALLAAARDADATIAQLTERIADLEMTACTDELTGILNRRGFEHAFERIIAGADRYGETGVLVYVDLDDFKPINDRLGHAAGDAVLVHTADTLVHHVRDTDAAARLGGDEFAVILTRTDKEAGLRRAEALGTRLNAECVSWQGTAIPVRASLGFQPFGPGDAARLILAQADHAMYVAKQERRALKAGAA